jgi:hypothetical protein
MTDAVKDGSDPVPAADYYEGPVSGFDVYSWSPDPPGTVNAKATQVHLHGILSIGRMLYRFKGPETLDRLIDALIDHREDVWGRRT